jgi:hypothetical protein
MEFTMTISATTQGLRPGVCTSSNRPATPFEGQMIYETDTDLTFIYGGSAWQQVSGGTAVGNSGLVYVKSQAITAGSATTVLTNVFSTTYDNYRVIIDGVQTTSSQGLVIRMGSAATGYYGNFWYVLYSATSWTFVPMNNATFWYVALSDSTAPSSSSSFDLVAPFLAARTQYNGNYYGRGYSGGFSGSIENTTCYTDLTLLNESGTLSGGTITVYGYRKP